ncbi:MAG: eukaryotic-like serine/threonine-protein kinase, partial [Myxococcales bacterium]|nr:eukaryotic-like serine/threonine-protein kinase [Myxococcales bacterium]
MQTNVASTATRRDGHSVSKPVTESWKRIVPTSRDAEREGDRYELLGELATGGMATVYLGRMRRPMGFNRLVAIKCMH